MTRNLSSHSKTKSQSPPSSSPCRSLVNRGTAVPFFHLSQSGPLPFLSEVFFFSQIRALSALALFPRSTPYIKPEFFIRSHSLIYGGRNWRDGVFYMIFTYEQNYCGTRLIFWLHILGKTKRALSYGRT